MAMAKSCSFKVAAKVSQKAQIIARKRGPELVHDCTALSLVGSGCHLQENNGSKSYLFYFLGVLFWKRHAPKKDKVVQ